MEELISAINVLKGPNNMGSQVREAASLIYNTSKGSKTKDLTRIGRLNELNFLVTARGAVTVAKLNVAGNKNTHPDTLDYMARQILCNGAYRDDGQIREQMLSAISGNRQTSETTLRAIAYHDQGINGTYAKDKIRNVQRERKVERDFCLKFMRRDSRHYLRPCP